MTEDLHAYSTSDSSALKAYRYATEASRTYGKRIRRDVEALGAGPHVYVNRGMFGSPDKLVALEQDGDVVPEGWRVVRGRLEPRRGRPGEGARQWLADHQPVDVRHVMQRYGLPRASWVPRGDAFGWRIISPELFEHDGELWACYQGKPGRADSDFDREQCTWTPRKVSEYYAAKEAFEAAQEVES